MTDQCMNCQCKGDIKKCLATDCGHHENWYAIEQQKKIDELQLEKEDLRDGLINMLSKFEPRKDNLFSQRSACSKARKILNGTP